MTTEQTLTNEQRQRIQAWVKALRSGNYTQTKKRLRKRFVGVVDPGPDNPAYGYCCLGVACDVYAQQTGQGRWTANDEFVPTDHLTQVDTDYVGIDYLPKPVQEWFGVEVNPRLVYSDDPVGHGQRMATTLNDEYGFDFAQIADAIERTYLTPGGGDPTLQNSQPRVPAQREPHHE